MAKKPASAKPPKNHKRANPRLNSSKSDRGPTSSAAASTNNFPIIGVGASAGGLEAFTELLHALPRNNGMAFVFVQHLDPKHVSMLAEILARESKMPVLEARSGVQVQPDHVYVIPRNTSVSIAKRTLRLGPRSLVSGQLTSIDTFFHALAEDQGMRSIGVLLSGNGSDGTSGLKAIKSAGGIALVQDPETAKYEGMPHSAIEAGCVDFVHKPSHIAEELVRLVDHPYIGKPEWASSETLSGSLDSLNNILGLVRSATSVDFRDYKPNTVKRRILRRMVLKQTDTIETYLGLLRKDPSEIQCLYDDLLINVTEFFRDPEMYKALAKLVFPRITAAHRKGTDRQIRIWVPGCSTGEEAYSLAMALAEFLGEKADGISIQIFATDISEAALKIGRNGVYPASIAKSVSPERLRRFFIKSDSGFQVQKHIRDSCIFARHNVTKDPPFSKLDLISCRNVLIYLGSVLQERVIPLFHYALNPNGYLILGSSEAISSQAGLFQLLDKKCKIYLRKPGISRIPLMVPARDLPVQKSQVPSKPEGWTDLDLQRETDRLVLSKYGPPGIVVDENLKICQFLGQTSQFLAPAAGAASFNVLRMVKEGLAAELKAALATARKEDKPVRREGVHLTSNGNVELNLQIIPFSRNSERDRKYLILFESVRKSPQPNHSKGKPAPARVRSLERENQHLRQELSSSRQYLQSIIEDQEASQEELQSATEEIQSSNEELQSTNEELETAKEELQSTNEELNTVNEELQNRNLQLARMGNELVNLLANVNMPILILGNDLRIHRFTPATEKSLNLIPSDIGRPIRDFNLRIRVPNLEKLLQEVIDTLRPRAMDVTDEDGRRYSLRIRPFRTEDNKIDGVVMVFVDLEPGKILDDVSFVPTGDVRAILGPSALSERPPMSGSALLQAQEEERRRLSHELHDELNQKLVLLELNLETIERSAEKKSPEFFEGLKSVHNGVSELSEDLRRIAYQLHPSILDDLGLIPALEAYCSEFSARENIQVRFSHRDVPDNLPSPVGLALYRVVQESLRNVAKHSSAKRASVTLTCSRDTIQLTVRDSGAGFVWEHVEAGLGMVGMKERMSYIGGAVEWKTKPGDGTQVIATVPFKGASRKNVAPPESS
ncbi:MAG TPA: chemotaxis protein CheB [Bryobacteraceae bacterium]|nr:chemotaxis protein CheB [Bryobacteraceae bacterium]